MKRKYINIPIDIWNLSELHPNERVLSALGQRLSTHPGSEGPARKQTGLKKPPWRCSAVPPGCSHHLRPMNRIWIHVLAELRPFPSAVNIHGFSAGSFLPCTSHQANKERLSSRAWTMRAFEMLSLD